MKCEMKIDFGDVTRSMIVFVHNSGAAALIKIEEKKEDKTRKFKTTSRKSHKIFIKKHTQKSHMS